MNGNGGAIHRIVLQDTLTSAKDGSHALPHAPHGVGPLGSQGTPLDEGLRRGNNFIDRLLTVAEVAALLNVPRKWVYRRVALGPPAGLPHVKVGKYLRFLETDLHNYIERLRRD